MKKEAPILLPVWILRRAAIRKGINLTFLGEPQFSFESESDAPESDNLADDSVSDDSVRDIREEAKSPPEVPKVQCIRCGTLILTATAERTGGLCMPCSR